MNRTQSRIAKELRKDIGKDYLLICSTPVGCVSQSDYLAAVSASQQAMHHARYLAQHLVQLDSDEFLQACGIRA